MYVATTHDGNIITNIHVDICYFTIFKDYVTGQEVLAGYYTYYLFQGRIVVRSHSAFISYILRSN